MNWETFHELHLLVFRVRALNWDLMECLSEGKAGYTDCKSEGWQEVSPVRHSGQGVGR